MSPNRTPKQRTKTPPVPIPWGAEPPPSGRELSAAVLAVADAATAREFLVQLNVLRTSLGLSYTQIAAKAGKGMSRSTAQAMLAGENLPARKRLHQFLRVCRVSPAEITLWTEAWQRLSGTPEIEDATETPAIIHTDDSPEPIPLYGLPGAPETADDPPQAPQPQRSGHYVIFAVAVLVTMVSASAIAMWTAHVPIEVIFAVYGVVIVCVCAWTVVLRVSGANTPRGYGYGGNHPYTAKVERYFDSEDTASQFSGVVGEDPAHRARRT